MNTSTNLSKQAKLSLYALLVGGALFLGGIAYQILVGVSTMMVTDEAAEVFGFGLMSRGSILIIIGYALVFIAGILFWLWGPYRFKQDRWFLIAFLLFYIWIPVDMYTIGLDLQFAFQFDPLQPLTQELKNLFLSRQQSLAPIPMIQLLGYLVAIGLAVFQPQLKKRRFKNDRLRH